MKWNIWNQNNYLLPAAVFPVSFCFVENNSLSKVRSSQPSFNLTVFQSKARASHNGKGKPLLMTPVWNPVFLAATSQSVNLMASVWVKLSPSFGILSSDSHVTLASTLPFPKPTPRAILQGDEVPCGLQLSAELRAGYSNTNLEIILIACGASLSLPSAFTGEREVSLDAFSQKPSCKPGTGLPGSPRVFSYYRWKEIWGRHCLKQFFNVILSMSRRCQILDSR